MGSGALNDSASGLRPPAPANLRASVLRGVLAAALAFAVVLLSTQSSGCGSDPQQPDGGIQCQQGDRSCPAGSICMNRVCQPNCDNGAACPPGEYCEAPQSPYAICSPEQPIACTTLFDCPAPQACTSGLCTSSELRWDGGFTGCSITSATGNDGCSRGSLCYQDFSSGQVLNRCIGLPHCSSGGACPVGKFGSTCNQRPDGGLIFKEKMRVCLFTYCAETVDCPQGTICFRRDRSNPLGGCSPGKPGSPCYTNDDCYNATYCSVADGGADDGGELGICSL